MAPPRLGPGASCPAPEQLGHARPRGQAAAGLESRPPPQQSGRPAPHHLSALLQPDPAAVWPECPPPPMPTPLSSLLPLVSPRLPRCPVAPCPTPWLSSSSLITPGVLSCVHPENSDVPRGQNGSPSLQGHVHQTASPELCGACGHRDWGGRGPAPGALVRRRVGTDTAAWVETQAGAGATASTSPGRPGLQWPPEAGSEPGADPPPSPGRSQVCLHLDVGPAARGGGHLWGSCPAVAL